SAYEADRSFAIAKFVGRIIYLKADDIKSSLEEAMRKAETYLKASLQLERSASSGVAIRSKIILYQTFVKRAQVLSREMERWIFLRQTAKQPVSGTFREKVPKAILKRLQLEEKPLIYDKMPMEKLASCLKSLPKSKEPFILILHPREKNENGKFIHHAIYL